MSAATRRLIFVLPALLPGVLVVTVPRMSIIAPILLLVGFGALIILLLIFSFRRSRLGPFALLAHPSKYLATNFTGSELMALGASASVGLGGALAVGVLTATQ